MTSAASFGVVKQIEAGLLDVGYVEEGPVGGPPAVLLHGWPYDIHSYIDVVPMLATAGYRVIVPYLRGFGSTRFLSDETFRNGEQAALGLDTIALLDALGIERAVLAGTERGLVRCFWLLLLPLRRFLLPSYVDASASTALPPSLCEHAFVTAQPHPRVKFFRAIGSATSPLRRARQAAACLTSQARGTLSRLPSSPAQRLSTFTSLTDLIAVAICHSALRQPHPSRCWDT
jgi:pimeloyl-ACP methyl ester carboxylesterase